MRIFLIILFSIITINCWQISVADDRNKKKDDKSILDSITFFSNGIVEYKSPYGKWTIGLYGKQLIKSNMFPAYGGHFFSNDNSNMKNDATNSGWELGDDNYGKGDLLLALRAYYQHLSPTAKPNKITLDFIKTDIIWRSRPIQYTDRPDENVVANTGRQTGVEFEGAMEIGAKFHEIHLTIKGGRFKVHGEEPLLETTDDLAHGGTSLAIDESAQYGDGIRFSVFQGLEHDPDFRVQMAIFDSATRMGESKPSRSLTGDISFAAKIQAKLKTFLSEDLAKSLAHYIGDIYVGVSGAVSENGIGIKQNSVSGIIGTARKVGPGKIKLRIIIGHTDRSRIDGSGMNNTLVKSVEGAYVWKTKWESGFILQSSIFANYCHASNLGGKRDELWKMPHTNKLQIFQLGVKFEFDNTSTFLDNLEFSLLAGTSIGSSKEFGGDPNEVYGMLVIGINFDKVVLARRKKLESLLEDEEEVFPTFIED